MWKTELLRTDMSRSHTRDDVDGCLSVTVDAAVGLAFYCAFISSARSNLMQVHLTDDNSQNSRLTRATAPTLPRTQPAFPQLISAFFDAKIIVMLMFFLYQN